MPKVVLFVISILVTIIFLVSIASFLANTLFNQKVYNEVKALFDNNVQNKTERISKADLEGLPLCVQKWLENSQVIGKERISTVRLKQKGIMRLKEGQSWMPIEAEQYFSVDEPGFIWKAKVKMAPFLYFAGRDKYYEGRGNMQIKLLSLINIVNATGKEIDQGTILRYLGEMAWFPTAALANYIKWEEIDANSARATINYGGIKASAVFNFNDKGEIINLVAKRYMEYDGKYVMETWSPTMKGYKEFNGIRIPNKIDVIWKLKTGDFNWFQCEITGIEYNKPVIYEK
ncbi:MAG: DUF6544 family protein [Bacillota bacterium]|jgi:hypothetical protein